METTWRGIRWDPGQLRPPWRPEPASNGLRPPQARPCYRVGAMPPEPKLDLARDFDAVSRGDLLALARIGRFVTGHLAKLGAYRQRDAWDDLVQEVIVRVWRAHRDGKIRDAAAVPQYLRQTTRNALVDWLRTNQRQADLPIDDTEPPAPEDPVEPATRIALRDALSRLSERHREVVEHIYLRGLSYDETAAALDRPKGTINRQQREAMAELRRLLRVDKGGA